MGSDLGRHFEMGWTLLWRHHLFLLRVFRAKRLGRQRKKLEARAAWVEGQQARCGVAGGDACRAPRLHLWKCRCFRQLSPRLRDGQNTHAKIKVRKGFLRKTKYARMWKNGNFQQRRPREQKLFAHTHRSYADRRHQDTPAHHATFPTPQVHYARCRIRGKPYWPALFRGEFQFPFYFGGPQIPVFIA